MTPRAQREAEVERLLRPRSIAIVGFSPKAGSASQTTLSNLTLNDFTGDIHLIGRSGGELDGRKIHQSIDDLPEDVDVAVFTLPSTAVKEALVACARRKVRGVVIFSAGFAEVGNRDLQDELAAIANEAGIALLGPNCLGYSNFVERIAISFTGPAKIRAIGDGSDPAIAIVSQSGGLTNHLRQALEARDLPVSYTVSTGNEAGLGLAEFIDFFAKDKTTRAIVVYVEEFRHTREFLAAAARALDAGKPILMLAPGRSEKAKAAVSSHTGALAGNYEVMRTVVAHSGIALVDTLDELIDTTEILARFPEPSMMGPGIMTFSGAFCAIAHDFCEALDLPLPSLTAATEAALKPKVSAFIPPKNPLDLGTQPVWQPELMEIGTQAMLGDPNIGSLLISFPVRPNATSMKHLDHVVKALAGNKKPVILAPLGDRAPLPQEFVDAARKQRIILSRSPDRTLRAIARATIYGRARRRARSSITLSPFPSLPSLTAGTQPEWLGKQLLKAAGIRIPEGGLAATPDKAIAIAQEIGFPVALKAQAGALAHKTEAGGVILNVADTAALRTAWRELVDAVQRSRPGLTLDGVLVERMAPKGLEVVIGAKRDPRWGPVTLVGLGGIWVEALEDVRFLAPNLDEEAIVEELYKLRAAKLLRGFRGSEAVDVAAIAKAASTIGRLIVTTPEITEIEVNPLLAHPVSEGITAVDALIVLG